ncbi:hypothetical protein Tco_1034721 [Tanacetum coccineum]
MIITISHNLRNLVVTEFDSTEKLMNKIGKLRAISGHVLGEARVQIPQNNLDNLQSIREEEDGVTEVSDPRDVPGSILLAVIDFATLYFLLGTDLGFDTLAQVECFTLVEDNRGLLVTLGMFPDDVTVSANQTVFFLLIGVTATNFSLGAKITESSLYIPGAIVAAFDI